MNPKKTYKKIYLINRDFQFRYTGAAVVVGLMSTALTTILILYPLYQFEILRIPKFLPPPVLFLMAVAAMINVFMVGFMGIFLTHRIAGPMYSMVRFFRTVEQGYLGARLKVRDGDELGYLVRNINAMMEGLSQAMKKDSDVLASIAEDLNSDIGEQERLDRIRQKTDGLLKSYKERMRESQFEGRKAV